MNKEQIRLTKKLHKIFRKYDKIKGSYVKSEKAEMYLSKNMPKIKDYIKLGANLSKFVYRSPKHLSVNFFMSYETVDSAVSWAARNYQYDLVKFFIEKGADINERVVPNQSTGTPMTVMREVIINRDEVMINLLLENNYKLSELDIEWINSSQKQRLISKNVDITKYLPKTENNMSAKKSNSKQLNKQSKQTIDEVTL